MKSVQTRRKQLLIILLIAGLLSVAWGAAAAQEAPPDGHITVTTTEDGTKSDDLCSLREAVITANKDQDSTEDCIFTGNEVHTIELAPDTEYVLTKDDNGNEDASSSGDLDIDGDLTIIGHGSTIKAEEGFRNRIIHVISGNVDIQNVVITGGSPRRDGGGVLIEGELTVVVLSDSEVHTNDTRGIGGGITNLGFRLELINTDVFDNVANDDGGGINSVSTLIISGGSLTGNQSASNGGGLANVGGSAALSGVAVSDNLAAGEGAGIYSASELGLVGVILTGNIAGGNGGAVAGSGDVAIDQATVGGNTSSGDGGGLFVSGVTNVTGSNFDGNHATGSGGAIANIGSVPTFSAVSITDNDSDGSGGGIHNSGDIIANEVTFNLNSAAGDGGALANGGTVLFANVTVSGNSSEASGGGIHTSAGSTSLNNVTVAFNVANSADGVGTGGGLSQGGGVVTIYNTIVAGNSIGTATPASSDCSGTIDSGTAGDDADGHNLVQEISGCDFEAEASDVIGFDPLLEVLSNNGGTTLTHKLSPGSPAIDKGNPGDPDSELPACESMDQRGNSRPQGDACDIGAVEVFPVPVSPFIIRVYRISIDDNNTAIDGIADESSTGTFKLNAYVSSTSCADALEKALDPNLDPLEFVDVTLTGGTYFQAQLTATIDDGQFVVVTLTGEGELESPPSDCVMAGGNDSWPNAMDLTGLMETDIKQVLDSSGQSRWYKFLVEPESNLIITLTNLLENYDLTLYTDIQAAFDSLSSTDANYLLQLGAEVAGDAFAASALSPDAFTPDAFTPDAFTPDAFTPDAFTPDAFTPDAFTPDAFTPDAFTPDAFTPDAFTPDAFTPDAFTPDAFTPDAFTPDAFTPDAFTSAQSRSLIGISAFEGTVSEGLRVATWNNDGYYYIRVRGRNGVFDPTQQFHLNVTMAEGGCQNFTPAATSLPTNIGSGAKTLFVADWTRMVSLGASTDDVTDLKSLVTSFSVRSEIMGTVADVGLHVLQANVRADSYADCPYAKNQVAEGILAIVDAYRATNPTIESIVILGDDDVIPFFRYPDSALLGNELNYYPPVQNLTHSQSSLRLGYVLSQDTYGADFELGLKDHTLPIASVPVGRLVETATDMMAMIHAYTDTNGLITPSQSLVTGYDFLTDSANAVRDELSAGIGTPPNTLITARDISPQDPLSWTADDLRSALFSSRHDVIFLAGHFSANSALAADYATRMTTEDLESAPADHFKNALIFSAGCHSGYNIVNEHGIPVITREPDWAQAFAQRGATLVAGTGYQYGDTDFIEYSERLYLEFSRQLRSSGTVSVGDALVRAKQLYLAGTPIMRGIHEKAYLEATLFGLPMMRVAMSGSPTGTASSIVGATQGYGANPGLTLNLRYADVTIGDLDLQQHTVTVTDPGTLATHNAHYFSGSEGVIANPGEPVLASVIRNVSPPFEPDFAGLVLRGVGFRGASYFDSDPTLVPLTSAAATEIRGVHTPFETTIFYPGRPWSVNYFGALSNPDNGPTYLTLSPVQVQSDPNDFLKVTFRQMDDLQFRLFYSNYTTEHPTTAPSGTTYVSQPAEADAPSIVELSSDSSGNVQVRLSVNPSAGVQEVWVTYTGTAGSSLHGSWQSVDLTQDDLDTSLWTGQINLSGTLAENVRFFVQAVNGVGMVSMDSNQGAYYIPGVSTEPTVKTSLSISGLGSGAYSTEATFSAHLQDEDGDDLAGKRLSFVLGPVARQATTDGNGNASATLPLLGPPNDYQARVTYGGDGTYFAASVSKDFEITKQFTTLTLAITPKVSPGAVTATLTDVEGVALSEKTIIFVRKVDGVPEAWEAVITNYAGEAAVEGFAPTAGAYTLEAHFGGTFNFPGGEILTVEDIRYVKSNDEIEVNQCFSVTADPAFLWPPDGKMDSITLLGTDPYLSPLTFTIHAVYQDEPLTKNFDAQIIGTGEENSVKLRTERDGKNDGRVYHIFATATSNNAYACGSMSPSDGFATVLVPVNHDNSDLESFDQGPLYNSLGD